jgi:peptidoglycan/xylan/chitin deacetylase (PgdA/CDA1 family)
MIIRHDDLDFRMDTAEYIAVHELFIKAGITETAVLQFAQFGNLGNFREDLISYMLSTPCWDFQLHGWQHDEYDKMSYTDIIRDLSASINLCKKLFGRAPTVWYPPWNRESEDMKKAAEFFGLGFSNESNDISKFIREAKEGRFVGTTLYFHAWNKSERDQVPEMLEFVKGY